MVQALVQSHFDQGTSNWRADGGEDEPDFVRGKGVGKTATAEWVAQANSKPLFLVTLGTLGLVPDDVELELRERFRLAQLWDCILLLDEADVYLAPRSTSDLERNSLVGLFLRALEYFSGVIFLTTNRVQELDCALKSRIDIKLCYPPWTEKQARSIWKSHLRPLPAARSPTPTAQQQPGISRDEPGVLEFAASRYNAGSEKAPLGRAPDPQRLQDRHPAGRIRRARRQRRPERPPPPILAYPPPSIPSCPPPSRFPSPPPGSRKKHFEMVAGDF